MVVCNDCSAVYRYFREETMHITGHERSWVPTMVSIDESFLSSEIHYRD